MNTTELRNTYHDIGHLLAEKKLKPAFDLIEKLITETGLGQFRDEYANLEQTYKYMLKYTLEGINDPERKKVYRHLLIESFELADKVAEHLQMKQSEFFIYQKKRGFTKSYIQNYDELFHKLEAYYINKELESLVDETITQKKENTEAAMVHQENLVQLFYHLWFRDRLTAEDQELVRKILTSKTVTSFERAMVVSALSLSLYTFFDEHKFMLLFDAYETDEVSTQTRALVALIINLYHYDERMPFFAQISGRLEILNENPEFKRHLEQILVQLIRSKETEKIQRKMEDEILPEMLKISPNLRNKLNAENLMSEGALDDENPEWQEILKDSPGLMNKMEELTEMQLEGADVFLSSFSMLKNYPFFSELMNWFLPFSPEHPMLQKLAAKDQIPQQFLDAISKSPMLCNSDKYSFFLSLQNIPSNMKSGMADSMSEQFDQMEEIENDEALIKADRKAEIASNQYIQDLYRFYKLHPQHTHFEDIFQWKFDFHNKRSLRDILLEDEKLLRHLAEFNFAKNHFNQAEEIYQLLLNTHPDDAELLQKTAFCFQKQGDYENALTFYLRADLFDLNKIWNLKKIALCYRNLNQPQKALDYYQQAEILNEKDLNIHVAIGHCHLELKNHNEALKCYFKVEYLSPGNEKVWRPIGWCSLLVGKKEQAERYYNKLIHREPNKYDLLNMGHVQLCLGRRKEALDYYQQSILQADNTIKEFLSAFEEDLQHLLAQGVNPDDIPILLDQVRYALEA